MEEDEEDKNEEEDDVDVTELSGDLSHRLLKVASWLEMVFTSGYLLK